MKALVFVAATAMVASAGAQAPVFHSDTRVVPLYATVKNSRGDLVTTLEQRAFTVYENGKPQPIVLFRNDDVPISLGILIDNSGSMRTKRAKVEAAALGLVRASNPQDEVFVLNFADTAQLDVPFTSDVTRLEAGIARVDAIGGTAMRDAVDVAEGYARGTRHARTKGSPDHHRRQRQRQHGPGSAHQGPGGTRPGGDQCHRPAE